MLLLVLACTNGDDGPTYTDLDSDPYVPWPDSGEEGTDEDGDGWSVEDGDCDDDDIYAHPGWEESDQEGNHTDGKDNDCDGTIDETFRGLTVLQQGRYDLGTPSRIVLVDNFGETDEEVIFSDLEVQPIQFQDSSGKWFNFTYEMADGVFDGWAVLGEERSSHGRLMVEVSPSGEVTQLVDFSNAELYPGGAWGVSDHPDGYYLVAGLTALYRVSPSGEVDTVATFLAEDGETALMLAFEVAVDEITGQIGVFGYYGGAALVDPESFEVTWVIQPDFDNITHNMWSASHWDTRGGFYAGGQDGDGWKVFRLNETNGEWVEKAVFDESWEPHAMSIDTVYGEYFMSAYGGQYPVVWELDAETGENPSQFFASPHSGTYFLDMWDLTTRY